MTVPLAAVGASPNLFQVIVLALLFEQPLRENFGHPRTAALLLAANGLLMLAGEVLRRRQSTTAQARLVGAGRARVSHEDADGAPVSARQEYKDVDKLGWRGALIVGLFQSLALFPGISRSGATMVGGLALGLRHHEAMRFAFMLATPIIIAASLKTTPDLITPTGRGIVGYAVLGCILSAVAAYLSVRFLDRYFQSKRLDPFAYYCLVAGVGALVLLPTK
ncbi:MAG TPA: undecaprenyl-diphosphate phosphatase [Chloroflexota bacterium]|nr:undecaprenyl-diphosphate phosphatase [Chloroflexota bacterium]